MSAVANTTHYRMDAALRCAVLPIRCLVAKQNWDEHSGWQISFPSNKVVVRGSQWKEFGDPLGVGSMPVNLEYGEVFCKCCGVTLQIGLVALHLIFRIYLFVRDGYQDSELF